MLCRTHPIRGDVHVSKPAVVLMTLERHMSLSAANIGTYRTLFYRPFRGNKSTDVIFVSFPSPRTFERSAWTSRSVCRPSLELAATSDLTSAFWTARWGSYARALVMHGDVMCRQPHIEVGFVHSRTFMQEISELLHSSVNVKQWKFINKVLF